MLKRMKSKKGFTLAELLIVVAIIAVLTAIAVPLFVGALNNAESSVQDANIRAVRSQAVSRILLAPTPSEKAEAKNNGKADTSGVYKCVGTPDGEPTSYSWERGTSWDVTAYVSKSGEVLKILFDCTKNDIKKAECVDTTDTTYGTDTKYKVTMHIKAADLNSAAAI